MTIYRVQGPDGAIHKFEGPDDATPEQVEAAAAEQFGSQPTAQQKKDPEWVSPMDMVKGFAKGSVTGGPMGGVISLGANALKNIEKVGSVAGNAMIDLGGRLGFNPNVNAALATAADIGIQNALPTAATINAASAIPRAGQNVARRLMTSALKPTIAQHQSGKAATAVDTLLSEGINATPGGAEKVRQMLDATNEQIANAIQSSGATVSKQSVAQRLRQLLPRLGTQVNPQQDIATAEKAGELFMEHPMLTSDEIPVALAQKLKQGTYRELSKKYGQIGSADVEAQKALARGLKEEIATAVPEVAPLNALDSKLIDTLDVVERRALMDANKNPMGLALLAKNPGAWSAFMADKSALFKSIAARMVNSMSQPIGQETNQFSKLVKPPQ